DPRRLRSALLTPNRQYVAVAQAIGIAPLPCVNIRVVTILPNRPRPALTLIDGNFEYSAVATTAVAIVEQQDVAIVLGFRRVLPREAIPGGQFDHGYVTRFVGPRREAEQPLDLGARDVDLEQRALVTRRDEQRLPVGKGLNGVEV